MDVVLAYSEAYENHYRVMCIHNIVTVTICTCTCNSKLIFGSIIQHDLRYTIGVE